MPSPDSSVLPTEQTWLALESSSSDKSQGLDGLETEPEFEFIDVDGELCN